MIGAAGRTTDVWAFALRGAARRLTHSSTWYFGPVLSPDAKTVAYVKVDGWGANVYTVPTAGGPERPVTADSGSRQLVRWTAGGTRISDVVLASGGAGAITQELSELGTGRRRTVPLEQGLVIVDWLPNGLQLRPSLTSPFFLSPPVLPARALIPVRSPCDRAAWCRS